MRKTLVSLVATLALAAPACGGGGSSAGSPAAGGCTAATATALSGSLTTQNIAFHPTCFSIPAGSTITIENKDGVTHTFTLNDGSVNQRLDAGTTQHVTAPATAGTFAFHCSIHKVMTGTLITT